jgi:hypothetical protein
LTVAVAIAAAAAEATAAVVAVAVAVVSGHADQTGTEFSRSAARAVIGIISQIP